MGKREDASSSNAFKNADTAVDSAGQATSKKVFYTENVTHSILTREGTEKLERRMNRKAREYASLDSEKDYARRSLLRTQVFELAVRIFEIAGKGVSGGVDSLLLETLDWVLSHYNPSQGKFSYYVRFRYAMQRKNPVLVRDQINYDVESLDTLYGAMTGADDLGFQSVGDLAATITNPWIQPGGVQAGGGESEEPVYSEFAADVAGEYDSSEFSEGPRISQEDRLLEGLSLEDASISDDLQSEEAFYIEFLSLVISFLEHAPNARDYTDVQKLYMRMLFTESTTRAVKERSTYEDCAPIARHERETFSAMELPFLDGFTVDVCRTILALWQTKLRDGFKAIIPDDYSSENRAQRAGRSIWRLPNSYWCDYIETAGFPRVGSSTISEQRAKFKRMLEELR